MPSVCRQTLNETLDYIGKHTQTRLLFFGTEVISTNVFGMSWIIDKSSILQTKRNINHVNTWARATINKLVHAYIHFSNCKYNAHITTC